MKHKYFFFLLLISTFTIGQNSLTNVNWYLDYINIDGTQFDNYFNLEARNIFINFTEEVINSENTLFYFSGSSSCNSFGGSYTIENTNEVKVNIGAVTLLGCVGALNFYELNYFNIVHNDFSYQIAGTGDNQILTLTSAINGNYAVYSKTPPTVTLFKTWYLSSIETGAGIVSIPTTDTPTLNLKTGFNFTIGRNLLDGFDGCNNFNGLYDMYVSNQNALEMFQFNGVSGSCGNNYNSLYTSVLSNPTNKLFNYSISNEGETLTLTNNIGEKLVYSDKILSNEENKFKNTNIYLAENPINTHLRIIFSEPTNTQMKYIIYSIEGKTIDSSVLQNDLIALDNLPSGLYFLKLISLESKDVKTLKFLKE